VSLWPYLHSDTAELAVSIQAQWFGEGEFAMCGDAVGRIP